MDTASPDGVDQELVEPASSGGGLNSSHPGQTGGVSLVPLASPESPSDIRDLEDLADSEDGLDGGGVGGGEAPACLPDEASNLPSLQTTPDSDEDNSKTFGRSGH